MLAPASAHIELAPRLLENPAHLLHPRDCRRLARCRGLRSGRAARNEALHTLILLAGEVPHFLRDLHRAEFWAAHRAEVGGLGAFCGQRLVVVLFGGVGVEGEVELVSPAELEARAAKRVVAHLGGGVAFRQVGGVGG